MGTYNHYTEEQREAKRQYAKTYRAKNLEKIRVYQKEYRDKEREAAEVTTIIPKEHDEQVLVIKDCDLKKIPIQRMFKAEGLRAGVPGLFVPVPSRLFHGLFIEMKRVKGSITSKEQIAWIELLNKQGYKAVICKGAAVAIKEIEAYLNGA